MGFIKSCISIFLIFCYGLGFTHNLIPHEHDSNSDHHEHKHSNSHHDHENQHINHQDHQDEGILDFMLCLLVELEHHEANLEFFKPAKANYKITTPTKNLKLLVHEISFVDEINCDSYQPGIPPEFLDDEFIYQSNSSFRGPPNYS